MQRFHLQHRLSYDGHLCTVRYIGKIGSTEGVWLGVEWDEVQRGKHSGEHQETRYFDCKIPGAGSFIRPTRKPDASLSFIEALKKKYTTTDDPPDQHAVISLTANKVFEEVGFDKIIKKLSQLHELKIIIVDDMQIDRVDDVETISATCPNIEELDLSRNRFERLQDVAQLCSALPKLHALRISGNRFRSLTVSTPAAFENIVSLEISNVLLTWPEISALLVLFPRLTTLVAPHNNISAVPDPAPLPHTLNVLDLSSNTLTALSALSPLSALPSLSTLIISHNAISTLSHPTSTVFPALTTLDMAFNALTTFQELDHLPAATPALSSLRVSHNPAYDGVSLDDGHMLTIARLAPSVSVLNHSVITLKERENAEIWYLSRIGRQLVAAVASEDAARVLAEHRRWKELCALHGEPVVAADLSANEKMLEAGLVNMEFWKGGRSVERKMPKGTPVSVVRGCVGRWFGVRPLGVRLVCAKEGGEKVVMEEVGDTRDLGMYLDAGKWRVQVEVMEVELHRISFAY